MSFRSNCAMRWIIAALLLGGLPPVLAGTITVTDTGAPSGSTCTLAQAIYAANDANGVPLPANLGSTTASKGTCASGANNPGSGANTIVLSATTYTFTTIDNYWYGPNATPPIASAITIEGNGALLKASHSGDPTPIRQTGRRPMPLKAMGSAQSAQRLFPAKSERENVLRPVSSPTRQAT